MAFCRGVNYINSTIASVKVIQWNCRSVSSGYTDLVYLIHKTIPDIILLQESWLSVNKKFTISNFRTLRLDRPGRGGGLLALVSAKMYHNVTVSFEHICSDCELFGVDCLLPGSSRLCHQEFQFKCDSIGRRFQLTPHFLGVQNGRLWETIVELAAG